MIAHLTRFCSGRRPSRCDALLYIGLYTQLYTVYVWTAATRIREIYPLQKKITPPSENLKTDTDLTS